MEFIKYGLAQSAADSASSNWQTLQTKTMQNITVTLIMVKVEMRKALKFHSVFYRKRLRSIIFLKRGERVYSYLQSKRAVLNKRAGQILQS